MANIKSRKQYINENYNRPSISDSRRSISDYERLKSQATNAGVKHVAKNLNMFPKEQVDMFINYIKGRFSGSVITLKDVESAVRPMLRINIENDYSRTVGTENLDIIKAISELIYDEMKERNLLDLSSEESFNDDESYDDEIVDEFDEDLDFNEDEDDIDGFQANDELRESVKRRKPIIRNRRK